jgi:hypothetical protein
MRQAAWARLWDQLLATSRLPNDQEPIALVDPEYMTVPAAGRDETSRVERA